MSKFHIPYDMVLHDGEDTLHEKVNNDINFSKYSNEMSVLICDTINDKLLRERIFETFESAYIHAEIAAYKEGFTEGIKFLMSILYSTNGSYF